MPPRRRKNTNWPKYVFEANGRIVYRPHIPKAKREMVSTDKSGRLKPPIRLGALTDSEAEILRAYLVAKEHIESIGTQGQGTLSWLADQYLKSRRFSRLSTGSQQDYAQKLNRFLSFPVKLNGAQATVGDIYVVNLTTPLLRNLLDKMLTDYEQRGYTGTSNVNGQFRVLSAMITYGLQYVANLGINSNPCKGVELHKEKIRDRYVTDEEYFLQLEFARKHGADYLPVFFEHAYLLAGRSVEIADLKLSSVTEDGYLVERRKGSKDNIILWSDRLREAHQEAMEFHRKRKMRSIFLIPGTTGRKLNDSSLKSAMTRLKSKMKAAGMGDICWNLHDLKRKGVTDAKDSRIAGHKTEAMRQRYQVLLEKYEAAR